MKYLKTEGGVLSKISVILNENIKGLGKKNEIVKVKEGYAQNFLFTKGLAKEHNKSNEAALKVELANVKAKEEELIRIAKTIRDSINGPLIIKTKAGVGDKLFGSIGSKDVADGVKAKFGATIEKKMVDMETIRHLGNFSAKIRLHKDVIFELPIMVEGI